MSQVPPTQLFPAGSTITRDMFPAEFLFGCSSSAFQYEGAPAEAGGGPSICETFLKAQHPDIVEEGGLEAIRHYHRYQEDIQIMKEMGWDSYRFSISWSRILPNGRRHKLPNGKYGGINQLGVDFYNNLIDKLHDNHIEPLVTLYHWDCPQALEDEYLGFLNKKIVDDFCDYADLCFELFGKKVRHWTTFNEAWSFAIGGYARGSLAPGRGASEEMSIQMQMQGFFPGSRVTSETPWTTPITKGDPSTEPYIVAHHQLLAHAAAVKVYRTKYQAKQHGVIGITNLTNWEVPYSDTKRDRCAAQVALDFMFGWFTDPITKGDYPKSMRKLVGKRLPEFSKQESLDLIGSFDYLGVNYYTANCAKDDPDSKADSKVKCTTDRNGVLIGEKLVLIGYVRTSYPRGIRDLLLYIKDTYNNPIVYITENGWDEMNQKHLSFSESLIDLKRISYHSSHLSYLKEAIDKGANVQRYYAWSLMDNLEWSTGFKVRFGIYFIDFDDNVKRYPKFSAAWFKFLLHSPRKQINSNSTTEETEDLVAS